MREEKTVFNVVYNRNRVVVKPLIFGVLDIYVIVSVDHTPRDYRPRINHIHTYVSYTR
jgi:hypothetical protein